MEEEGRPERGTGRGGHWGKNGALRALLPQLEPLGIEVVNVDMAAQAETLLDCVALDHRGLPGAPRSTGSGWEGGEKKVPAERDQRERFAVYLTRLIARCMGNAQGREGMGP